MNFAAISQKQLNVIVLALATLAGFLLRLRHADIRPLWLDEIHTFQVVNLPKSFLAMINLWWTEFLVSDPPLYYVLNYLTVGGDPYAPQWLLRIVSIFFGTAAIPLTWACFRLIATNAVAIFAAVAMAFNVFAIQYSQEYRPYSQLLFFTILYFWAQLHVIKSGSWKSWGLLLASAFLLLYTHYFGGFSLAAGYIIWGVCLKINKAPRARWVSFSLTPIVLAVLYIPVIMYGWSQTKHFSGAGQGGASDAILKMYQDQKAHTYYWTDLPYSLATFYLGRATMATTFLLLFAVAGVLVAFALRWKQTFLVVVTCFIVCGFGYGFYEVMKYPYEPRRSIGVLPFLLIFQAYGLYFPIALANRSHGRAIRVPSLAASFALLGVFGWATLNQYIQYDAKGYRNQANQADWPAMAHYIKEHASENEPVALHSGPGNTWVQSQFSFYHNRQRVQNPVRSINTLEGMEAALRTGDITGLWYVVCFPSTAPDNLFQYLLTNGQWQPFFGGALVYVAAPEYPKGTPQAAVLSRSNAYHALAVRGAYGRSYDVHILGPGKGSLGFSEKQPLALLPFTKGRHRLSVSDGPDGDATTPTLYKSLSPGQWNPAINFSEWRPGNKAVDIVLDDAFEPALQMQYNGTVIYRYYLNEGGRYDLTLEVKNDAPGPIDLRIFASNAGELERPSFSKADNNFSLFTCTAQLKAGLNELTIYYPSFKRIPHESGDPNDSFNEFIFSRWRLDRLDLKIEKPTQ